MDITLQYDRWFIPLFMGFQPSKVVPDFFHPQYCWILHYKLYSWELIYDFPNGNPIQMEV